MRYVLLYIFFFFFKQKTSYEMRISDWSSDVCSSDLTMIALYPASRVSSSFFTLVARSRSSRTSASSAPRSMLNAWRESADTWLEDRKSVVEGKSVSVRVDLGGRRIIKKKNKILNNNNTYNEKNYNEQITIEEK